ncbi:MAG: NAD(+)/NADH kinase [Thermoplasmata archaeon]|nr:NAD(+)/NADH kinase [Thermoplasmata archaeon]MCI4341557.1 NAD(+)/NADH kinase [Thermoplasmata archaeon]
MRVGVTVHPEKAHAVEVARRIVSGLRAHAEVVLAAETEGVFDRTDPSEPLAAMRADVLVAVGGDGTFLWALQRSQLPLLPVHAGTVGFLAEVDGEDPKAVETALSRLRAGEYHLEDRMRLSSEIDGRRLPDATNDVVVHTAQVAKMRLFELSLDGQPVGQIRADGIILGTPTGSTSYSLSASGPVVDPSLEAIELCALAPFRTSPRAVVLDPWRTVGIRLLTPEKEAVVVVDGQSEFPLRVGERIAIYRSPRRATFVRFGTRFVSHLIGKGILPWTEPPATGRRGGRVDLPAGT